MTKRVKITSGVVGPFPPGLISPGQSPINIQKKRNKGKKKKKKKKKSNKAKSMAKGLPCAKMLVRSGLRCSCHFVYTEKCPARARNRLLCAAPAAPQSLPATAQSPPAAAQSLPEAAQSLPVAAQSLPAAAQSLPAAAQSLPVAAQSLPAAAPAPLGMLTHQRSPKSQPAAAQSLPAAAPAQRQRRRLLCAKMSVRSGLRCRCHYVYAEKCPAQSNYEMLS